MNNEITLSAVFSIAVHASFMLIMAGWILFPEVILKSAHQLEVVIAESSTSTLPQKSASKTTQERRLHTQGNAQWSIKPGSHDEVAGKNLKDQALKHRTVSATNHEARDAEYLTRWRERVEKFGTQYYQSQIKKNPYSGEVRILVSIGSKGELLGSQLRQSSGQPALDAMAMEILRKSAPFEPLPEAIRADTDVLEIIRTWKFTAHEGLRAG